MAGPKVPKPVVNGPKRHHFLPRFYLENFAENGLLAVYDRKVNEIRSQQPHNTGVIGHFYTMKDSDGRNRFEIEQILSEYEGKSKPIIDKLADGELISEDERSDLAIFISFAAMRTPDVIDSVKAFNSKMITSVMKTYLSDIETVADRLRQDSKWIEKSDEEVLAEATWMVDWAQNDKVLVTTEHRWSVRMAMEMAFKVAPILSGRDWLVLHRDNDRRSFITTDAPVLLTSASGRSNDFWGVGFGSADALLLFPLKGCCILAMVGDAGNLRHFPLNAEKIRRMNLALTAKCQRFLIGRHPALVRSLAQATGLARTCWQPKISW